MATVENLVTKLRELGGGANNPDLKAALGVKDKDWELLKRSALKAGVVVMGRGFGGRLILADSAIGTNGSHKQVPTLQNASTGSYGALKGKKLMLVDKDGKPQGKLSIIGELAVTEGMVVAVVE